MLPVGTLWFYSFLDVQYVLKSHYKTGNSRCLGSAPDLAIVFLIFFFLLATANFVCPTGNNFYLILGAAGTQLFWNPFRNSKREKLQTNSWYFAVGLCEVSLTRVLISPSQGGRRTVKSKALKGPRRIGIAITAICEYFLFAKDCKPFSLVLGISNHYKNRLRFSLTIFD